MKKIISLLALCATTASLHANDTTSHTFFSIQPQFHAALPAKISSFYDRMTKRECGIQGALQIVPLASKSINETELARFFMPFGKATLVAGEFNSQAVIDNTVDILANYFGVLTQPVAQVFQGLDGLKTENLTFQSTIRFRPVQSVFAIGLAYKQKIAHFDEKDHAWFVHVSTALMRVNNDLGFTESITNEGGGQVPEGFVGSVGDALRGKTVFGSQHFEHGKISDCGGITKWGMADIELAFGHEDSRDCQIKRVWYCGLVVPAGNKPQGEFIFEPIVGNNKHWGLTMGGEYAYKIWANCDQDKVIEFHINAHSQYLFANIQKRSFDLIDKQWSRYIWMYEKVEPTASVYNVVPGINALTRHVKVTPRSSFNNNTSIVFNTVRGFRAEGGYSAYYRQAEEVDLQCPFPDNFMIAGIDEGDTDVFVTQSNASMRHFLNSQGIKFDTDTTGAVQLVKIKESDIDLYSASHPCMVGHSVWGTLGYHWDSLEFPFLICGGGAYEFSADNNGLHRWTIWGKFTISF